MAGLQHVRRAPKKSTKFTPRASSGRTTYDRSRRKPKPLFRRRLLAAPERPKPISHQKELSMSSTTYVDHPRDTAISDALTDLALDLRWAFNHSADRLWEQLDPELWEMTHNPWVLLQTVSREKLQSVTEDPRFQRLLADLHRQKRLADESE